MITYVLPSKHAHQHTAILDSIARELKTLRWITLSEVVVNSDLFMRDGLLPEHLQRRVDRQKPRDTQYTLTVIGNEGIRYQRHLSITISYEVATPELYALLQKTVQQIIGETIWKSVVVLE